MPQHEVMFCGHFWMRYDNEFIKVQVGFYMLRGTICTCKLAPIFVFHTYSDFLWLFAGTTSQIFDFHTYSEIMRIKKIVRPPRFL